MVIDLVKVAFPPRRHALELTVHHVKEYWNRIPSQFCQQQRADTQVHCFITYHLLQK